MMVTESIVNLAEDFLSAHGEVQSDSQEDNRIREERDKWRSKLDELDEDDPLYAIAKENYEEKDEQLNQSQRKEERYSELEKDLLKSIAEEFLPRGEWTDKSVLKAINIVLLDSDRDYIEVDTTRIEDGTEVEDDEALFDIALSVRSVAKEELQETSNLKEFWDNFETLDRYELFKQVAQADQPLTGKDIAKLRDEEENRQSISQTLINTTNGKVNPYFKQGRGEYSLSFVGEYLVRNFWDGDVIGNEEGTDENGDGDGDQQSRLDVVDDDERGGSDE